MAGPDTLEQPATPPQETPPAKAPDAPRRCFICLADQLPSDPPSDWVDPCPCTLEAHQDCMLSWVTDRERSNKPLECPVCKSVIQLEGPWDPIVALSEGIHRRFTRASPYLLFTGVTVGVQFSAQLYGAVAMWVFAGRGALLEYLFGTQNKFARAGRAATLMNVGPVLLLSHMLPGVSNRILCTSATMYGLYQVMHDDTFLAPPTGPRLAFTLFPGFQSLYYNLYREFVWPYEVNLNRQINGLPPIEARQNDTAARDNRRNADRNAEVGIIGFLQTLLDALDPEDEDRVNAAPEQQPGEAPAEEQVIRERVVVEVFLEERFRQGPNADDGDQDDWIPDGQPPPAWQGDLADGGNVEGEHPNGALNIEQAGGVQEGGEAEGEQEQDNQHEAPQAPPVRRTGIGTILSNVSNSIVSTLFLPVISAAVGEALRLALPASWTARVGLGDHRRLGFLQHQWGRSLIGGCLFVVLKDAVRIYTKSRKVAAMGNRRVKNVKRRRRDQ